MRKVGIIVGRFQVPRLTDGHMQLISACKLNFDKVIVFIGTTKGGYIDRKNPLPFEARRNMLSVDKDLSIYQIEDVGNYEKWTKILDEKIYALKLLGEVQETDEVYLCGSRDSITSMYKSSGGIHNVHEVEAFRPEICGTTSRDDIYNDKCLIKWTEEARKAAIWMVGEIKKEE